MDPMELMGDRERLIPDASAVFRRSSRGIISGSAYAESVMSIFVFKKYR